MERRGQQEMGSNPMGYTPSQESPVKLPLAPIISTPPDHRRPNAIYSARRGSSIFSPTQTLNHPYSPPPHHHHHQLSPPLPHPPAPPQSSGGASPDPDPTTLTASGASNPNDPAPSSLPPPPEAPAAANAIRYKECLKNHAASMGAHVVDGCGEFMPCGVDGTPEALRCAACDCHRNFHRQESCGEHPGHHHHNHPVANNISSSSHRQNPSSAPPHLRNQFASPEAMVSFGGDSSSEDLDAFQPGGQAAVGPSLVSGSKKRFRTKFSKDQKERMLEFAGKLGWRVQKQDEVEVQQFCGEVGVKRQVFKVWMHNNKQAMRKRERSE